MLAAASFLALYPGKREKIPEAFSQAGIGKRNIPRFFSHRLLLGVGLSTVLGYISSFLGIGAGFIYVPAFVYLLDLPVHTATATSQFILAIMAFTGSSTHILGGLFHHGIRRTLALVIGVIFGAQLGAWLSERVHGDWIIRGLAVALGLVGIRLLVMAWH